MSKKRETRKKTSAIVEAEVIEPEKVSEVKNYESDKLHIREEFTSLKKEQIKILMVYVDI